MQLALRMSAGAMSTVGQAQKAVTRPRYHHGVAQSLGGRLSRGSNQRGPGAPTVGAFRCARSGRRRVG